MDFKDYGTFVSNFKSIKNFSEEEIISKSYLYRPTCGVYFLIREDKIVYVGQSIDVFSRIYTHFRENVKEFDNFYFIGCNREDIDLYETFYIQKFQPTYNCIDSTLPSFKTLQQLRIRWNKIYGIDYRDIVNIDALNKITTLYDKYYFLPEVEKLCEPSLKGDLYVLDNLSRKEKIKIWRLKFINHLSVTEIGTELNIDVAILGKFLAILKYASSSSIPINSLLRFLHATPVVPEPIVKSNTVSFSFVYVLIRYSNNLTGFCVGCWLGLSFENSNIFLG